MTTRSALRAGRALLTLALVSAGAACADRAVDHRSDSDAGLPRWSLASQPELRIGGDDGSAALYRVMDAVRLPDGRVAVVNAGGHQVRIVGPDGRTLRTLGQEGDGPGEFRAPVWIGVRGDTLLVADVIASRILRFLTDGTFLGAAQFDEAVGMFPQVVGQYGDGRLLVAADEGAATSSPGVVRGRTALLRLGTDGRLLDTLAVVPSSEQFVSRTDDGRGIQAESLPFGRRTVLAIHDDLVYVGTGETPAVHSIRGDGRRRDLLRVAGDPRPVTAADRDDYWRYLISSRSGTDAGGRTPPEGIPYPRSLPPYGDLQVDRAGRVWLGESRLPREWERPAPYRIFSPGGEALARLEVPPRALIMDAGNDWVLLREMDPEQREMVSVYRITRPR